MISYLSDPRFAEIKPFEKKIWLSSPTIYPESKDYMIEAYETNWMSTIGKNIDEIEEQIAAYVGVKHAVALSAGTASLHLAMKLAGERLYGQASPNEGTLSGKRVFCSEKCKTEEKNDRTRHQTAVIRELFESGSSVREIAREVYGDREAGEYKVRTLLRSWPHLKHLIEASIQENGWLDSDMTAHRDWDE